MFVYLYVFSFVQLTACVIDGCLNSPSTEQLDVRLTILDLKIGSKLNCERLIVTIVVSDLKILKNSPSYLSSHVGNVSEPCVKVSGHCLSLFSKCRNTSSADIK